MKKKPRDLSNIIMKEDFATQDELQELEIYGEPDSVEEFIWNPQEEKGE